MKESSLKWLSLAGKGLSLAGGLAIYVDKLPASWLPIVGIVFAVASILKDVVNRVGDIVDDGKVNNSFK